MISKSMVSLDINISGVKAKDTAFKDQTFGHRNLIDKYEITRIVRKGVIDVQELSDRCFIFSLAAALKHTDYHSLECKENPENYIDFIKENRSEFPNADFFIMYNEKAGECTKIQSQNYTKE